MKEDEKKKKSSSKKKMNEKAEEKNTQAQSQARQADDQPFPIVGIGASAGGLQALETFFARLQADCGMAFVIVQHLDPHRESLMNSLLSKETQLKVNDIQDGVKLEVNQVYIKPPGKDVIIKDRGLYLKEAAEKQGVRLPIDSFFRSLAEDQHEKAVCIILSGASKDGTLGAKAIKGEGGMVMAQDERQAQYPQMPKSVIDAGLADIILPVEDMPAQLLQLIDHPFIIPEPQEVAEKRFDKDVQSILMQIRTHTGHDFTQYKRNTVLRRIQRRMALNQIADMGDYRRYLLQNPNEVNNLFEDMTINVTSFFRDGQTFEALLKKGLKPLMKKKDPETSFRVWVPGCASGEEAYSLAILLIEASEEMEMFFDFKVFATDINAKAIEAARAGEFPENIRADINEERLKRFFTRRGQTYFVDSKIRDLMIFAIHDVTRDPPFSNMELISCRNLLIYMDSDLQKRVRPILHYALKPEGILFLGTSETVGEASELFTPLDKKHKIYQHRAVEVEPVHRFRVPVFTQPEEEESEPQPEKLQQPATQKKTENVRELVERAIIEKYSPPAVLINESSDIIYFHGRTGRYLSPPEGEPNFNLFNMVQGDLHFRLSQAVERVKKEREAVRAENVQARIDDDFLALDLVCTPVNPRQDKSRFILVEFNERKPSPAVSRQASPGEEDNKDPAVLDLERKLQVTRHDLQATIEELETANEELKSSNEELQANNEELQSTNEELESSREELQSTNEELETVNAELSKKNQDLMKIEDDLNNLFASSDIGTLFLDNNLNIKRFTPVAKEVFNLKEERDLGRSINDITNNLQYETLAEDAEEVLDKLIRKESKVRGNNNKSYVVRIVPYRSRGNMIEGVIITFVDITDQEISDFHTQEARNFFYTTLSALWEPVLILDQDLKILLANRAFLRTFKTTPKETENCSLFELGDNQWDIPELRKFLEEIIPTDEEFENYEVEHEFPGLGRRKMSLNARRIQQDQERPAMILVSFRDITDREQ